MLAYLFSRYPVVSQTFCDSEMLALEDRGVPLVVGSLNPPPDSFRHARLDVLRAEVIYPPPPPVLRRVPEAEPEDWATLRPLIAEHDRRYGNSFKAETRARNALAFARAFRRRGVRHVHVHFANRATHTALFLAKLGFPFSFTAHAKDFQVGLGSDDLLREMADAATAVIAVSEFSRDLLATICPAAAGKIFRVYNGITPESFPSAAPGARAAGDPLNILSIGRLVPMKGFCDLIDAVARLRDRGLAAHLEIVGTGPDEAALRGKVSDLSVGDRVTFSGPLGQDAIKARLAAAHVFALACRRDREGGTDILPTVIMEAMAAGLPVVSTDFVGIPEMVIPEKTGLLVPPDSPAQLADALARLAGDPPHAARLGDAGRSLCLERFSLDLTTPQLAAHFPPEALEPAPARPPGLAYLIAAPPASSTPGTTPRHDPAFADEVSLATARPEVVVIAMAAPDAADPTTPAGIEFLPDGVVLEAYWRRATHRWAQADSLRADLGTAIDGETFYRDARRALYLIGSLRARGIHTVHATRSSEILLAWLLVRLGGFRATFAAERSPLLSRSLIEKLAADFADASISDDRLAERLAGRFPDVLQLGSRVAPATGRASRLVRRLKPSAHPPSSSPAATWLDRLLATSQPPPSTSTS